MTTAEQAQTPEDATEATEPKDTGGGLRKQLEASLAENKELKTDARARAFNDAGLDTTNGLGKAISQVYEGKATAEAVATFAQEEYGWVQQAPVDTHPAAQAIHEGNARLDTVQQASGSIAPPTEADALAKAEAEGDTQTSMAIKAAQVQSWFGGDPNPR